MLLSIRYIFNYGNHNVAMTSPLQAVSSYIQRLLPACWGFPQAPRTARKWSGYAFGSRTLNGCARIGIVHFGYIIKVKTVFKALSRQKFLHMPKITFLIPFSHCSRNYRRICHHKQEIIAPLAIFAK